MLPANIIAEAVYHAQLKAPAESCGLVIIHKGKHRYMPCRNVAVDKGQFQIDEEDYAAAEDLGLVVAVVHSHPDTNTRPSQADLRMMEQDVLPWLIVNPLTCEHTITEPSGYELPLIGREFVHGIVDCLSIIQDVYRLGGVELPDFEREGNWWEQGKNHYLDRYEECGFYLADDLQDFDVVLMQIQSPVPNHGAVYLDNYLIQHCQDRLSSRDVYDGYWRKTTTHILRHHERDTLIRSSEKIREQLQSRC